MSRFTSLASRTRSLCLLAAVLLTGGCAATTEVSDRRDAGGVSDASAMDAQVADARVDAPNGDAAASDLGPGDAATDAHVDLGSGDMSVADLGTDLGRDAGALDLGPPDLGAPDLGPPDLGPPDLGPPDMGLCANILSNPTVFSDMDVWNCGVVVGQLGACAVNDASGCGTCSCDSYVYSTEICASGSCGAPINGTGCSDGSYYSGSPFFCSGDRITQSACMLRYLITNGFCT